MCSLLREVSGLRCFQIWIEQRQSVRWCFPCLQRCCRRYHCRHQSPRMNCHSKNCRCCYLKNRLIFPMSMPPVHPDLRLWSGMNRNCLYMSGCLPCNRKNRLTMFQRQNLRNRCLKNCYRRMRNLRMKYHCYFLLNCHLRMYLCQKMRNFPARRSHPSRKRRCIRPHTV